MLFRSRGLYFSYQVILTLTTERMVAAASKEDFTASWELEDARFFWNRHLTKPISGILILTFLTANSFLSELKAHGFILPVIQGFVSELKQLDFGKKHASAVTADLVLIARRSVKRLGTRHWRRGADQQVN